MSQVIKQKRIIAIVGSPSASGNVDSVNGKTGVVVLTGSDINTSDSNPVKIADSLNSLAGDLINLEGDVISNTSNISTNTSLININSNLIASNTTEIQKAKKNS